MRYLGEKKIAMYYGDGRPRTRYRNGQRIGGWKLSEKSGTALSWDGTYNDKFLALSATGGTTQTADYRKCEGESTQVVTVQGKNICPTSIGEWESGEYYASNGAKSVNLQRVRVRRLIAVLPNTVYHFSLNATGYSFVIRAYDNNQTFTRTVGSAYPIPTTLTTSANEYYFGVTIYNPANPTSQTWDNYVSLFNSESILPFICSNSVSDKSYAPFVPDSPSPPYPSPITPYVVGGTYRLPGTTLEVTTPNLHGKDAVRDRVVWDARSGVAWVDMQRTKRVFSNATGLITLWGADAPNYGCYVTLQDGSQVSGGLQCSHFSLGIRDINVVGINYATNNRTLSFNIPLSVIGASASSTAAERRDAFGVWLSNNNVEVIYNLATPTRTPLTLTDNPDSTAPELPMEAFAPAVSEDYPYGVYNAGGNNLIPPAGDPIPMPILRGRGDYRDTYNVLTGELIRRIDPDIDNCTTRDITDPTVLADYILDPPVHDDQAPRVVATQYGHTDITQDGPPDTHCEITATCRVVDI